MIFSHVGTLILFSNQYSELMDLIGGGIENIPGSISRLTFLY